MKEDEMRLFCLLFLVLVNCDSYHNFQIPKYAEKEHLFQPELCITLSEPYKNADNFYRYVQVLANRFNVDALDLFKLIYFETAGTFNPNAKNPITGASGIVQFTNESSRKIKDKNGKFLSSASHLVKEYPTIEAQLEIPNKRNWYGGPVYQYLDYLDPFEGTDDLYLAFFYPPGRKIKNFEFPDYISKVNGGIKNIKEYREKVNLAFNKIEREV